jgi:hypothetical protein
MNIDQQILDHLFHKWGSDSEKLALNEQYRYTPPYPIQCSKIAIRGKSNYTY